MKEDYVICNRYSFTTNKMFAFCFCYSLKFSPNCAHIHRKLSQYSSKFPNIIQTYFMIFSSLCQAKLSLTVTPDNCTMRTHCCVTYLKNMKRYVSTCTQRGTINFTSVESMCSKRSKNNHPK